MKEKPYSLKLALAAAAVLAVSGEVTASDGGEARDYINVAEARFLELTTADSAVERGPVLWEGVMRSITKSGEYNEQSLDISNFPSTGSGTFVLDSVVVNAYADEYNGESPEVYGGFQQTYTIYESEVIPTGVTVELPVSLEKPEDPLGLDLSAPNLDYEIIEAIADWAQTVRMTVGGDEESILSREELGGDIDLLRLFSEGMKSHDEFPISWEVAEQTGDDGEATYTVKIQPGTIASE